MKVLMILYLISLSATASCTNTPTTTEEAMIEADKNGNSQEFSNASGFLFGQDEDSIQYVTLSLDNREVQVRILPDERERWKVPCTYVLDDGQVIHYYCEGLHHTPHRGKGRWKIREVRAGLLYIEQFRDSTSFRPGPFMPEVVLGKEPMPYRLEYFSPDYSRHLRTVELYASNPYTPDKITKIEVEQTYEAEHGFAPPDDQEETAYLWTWSWVQFFATGHAAVCWRLQRYNASRGLQGFTTTVSILDESGAEIHRLRDVDEDITPALVTPDGRYLGVMLNTNIDINAYPNRLGQPGIRIYDMTTDEIAYEDVGESILEEFGAPVLYRNIYIRYRKKDSKMGKEFDGFQIILNMKEHKRYERLFSKKEWEEISKSPTKISSFSRGILDIYDFKETKF